jgi:hypothetical protein
LQFRIVEILIVVAVIGLAIVSLQQATPQFESIFYSITLLTILTAFMMAIARRGSKRSFWLAFGLAGSAYLGFAHVPDDAGNSPRQFGPEVTTQVLWLTYNWTRDAWGQVTIFTPGPGGVFCIQDEIDSVNENDPFKDFENDPFKDLPNSDSAAFVPNLTLIYGGGQQIVSYGDLPAFMRIGHCFWAMAIGYFFGHFVEWLSSRTLSAELAA